MTDPDPDTLLRVLDATWPAARYVEQGPWLLREGKGGGQRVSAATPKTTVSETDIDVAETGMADLDQPSIFMIRTEDAALDHWLEQRGYDVVDPVTAYVSRVEELVAEMPLAEVFPVWPPMAVQREIWLRGGIGPARIAVMERVEGAKTTLLARKGDIPAGVAFVGIDDDVAMLHALEVQPDQRRTGLGRKLLQGAARWAMGNGAAWISLMVTTANTPANRLYQDLAMTPGAGYHYRRLPEGSE